MIDNKKIEAAARRYREVTDCDKQETLLIEKAIVNLHDVLKELED